jgi:hypothetical protein
MGRLLKSILIRRPAKSSYPDLPEEKRQKIKDLLFIISYLFKKFTFFISIVRFCYGRFGNGSFWLWSVLVMG